MTLRSIREFAARGPSESAFFVCWALSALACHDGSSHAAELDSGTPVVRDASSLADAGSPRDAGAPLDASRTGPDAAAHVDAAASDAATPLDGAARDAASHDAAAQDAAEGTADAGTGGSFAAVQAIFDERCISCHDATRAGLPSYSALPLTSGASFAALVDQPAHESCGGVLVKPFKPDESYLVHKTTDSPPCEGVRMPRAFEVGMVPPLTDAQHATIRAWIAAGAPR